MYNSAKEHASLNQSNANFSNITPKPTFLPIKTPKKSSTQTVPITTYVINHISPKLMHS